MRKSCFWISIPALLAVGCIAEVDLSEEGEASVDSSLVSVTAGAIGPYDVGVLRGSQGCPGEPPPSTGTTAQTIFLDNEDRRNANNRGGWQGWSYSDPNTRFEFCRVDGRVFGNLAQPYMVLALHQTSCPPNTKRITRYFDTDNGPNNASYSDITTITTITPEKNVYMTFCVFEGGGGGGFPNLGFEYGVFARKGSSFSLQDGFFYLDDEDTNNNNFWIDQFGVRSGTGANRDFWGILNGGTNTGMDVARVR